MRYSTLKATREPSTLDALWDRAQHVLTRIDTWRQRLHLLAKPVSELNECEFANVSTAKLSHLIVQILIFRVLHRRLFQAVPVGENPSEPIATIFERCHASASAVTELVSCMSAKHFASFWPTCKSLCFRVVDVISQGAWVYEAKDTKYSISIIP